MTDDDVQSLERRMIDTVAATVADTDWAPPEGAVLTECVVVMGWLHVDGTYASSYLRCGSPWGTHGLAERAVARMRLQCTTDEDDDDDG